MSTDECSMPFGCTITEMRAGCMWPEKGVSPHAVEIPGCLPGVCRLAGGKVYFAGPACLLVRGVVWCRSEVNSVHNRLKRVLSVKITCLIGSSGSSFSSVRCTGSSASV